MSPCIELNRLETDRFGVRVANVIDTSADISAINFAAKANSIQMLSVRVETSNLNRVHQLEADGYQLMDTLVYYEHNGISGQKVYHPTKPLPEDFEIRLVVPEDADAVADVARAAFAGYLGHYHSDPRLDNDASDAAYVEWAETSIRAVTAARPALLALRGGAVCGFLTLRLNVADTGVSTAEVVLNAVQPDARRGGIYARLVAQAMELCSTLLVERLIVSTQINNYAVQKVWSRLGFEPYRSLYTFHKWFD